MIKYILAALILTSNCFASVAYYGNLATPTYVNDNKFSIDGYDFIDEEMPFSILEGATYIVNESAIEFLPGDSFRKLVFISTLDGQNHIFKTRIINNTTTATIVEVKENWRKAWQEVGDYGPAYTVLDAAYDLTLEDGSILNAYLWFQDIIFLPGDKIVFKEAWRETSDFTNTFYRIDLMRAGKKIATLGYRGITRERVTGFERKEGQHGDPLQEN